LESIEKTRRLDILIQQNEQLEGKNQQL
jgi:chromosome segregation ATPase